MIRHAQKVKNVWNSQSVLGHGDRLWSPPEGLRKTLKRTLAGSGRFNEVAITIIMINAWQSIVVVEKTPHSKMCEVASDWWDAVNLFQNCWKSSGCGTTATENPFMIAHIYLAYVCILRISLTKHKRSTSTKKSRKGYRNPNESREPSVRFEWSSHVTRAFFIGKRCTVKRAST